MYITETKSKKRSGKVYSTILLRQSYREGGKVKNCTLANLSHWTPEDIAVLRQAIAQKNSPLESFAGPLQVTQGLSVGAVYALHKVAERLGIASALGDDFQGKLALWQVLARVLDQGSRLSATRIATIHDMASVMNLKRGFDENDLYANLGWIEQNQAHIEQTLFKKRKGPVSLFLYDVTSSYFEGMNNELSQYGYNRDGKKRKKQIVIGLLCDQEGNPISVDVFEGNTQDVETFIVQIRKVLERFDCHEVTFVGDRGMIKSEQIEEMRNHSCHYITALTLPQLEKLLRQEILSLDQFEETFKQIITDDIRYVYRRNPARARESENSRLERLAKAKEKVDKQNLRLAEKPLAKPACAKKDLEKYLKRLCLNDWVEISVRNRNLELLIDQQALKKKAQYDGCYVVKTSVLDPGISGEVIYKRYRDLALVETAFRTCKTTFLDLRPIYVRTAPSTRGHVFVVMLAYLIVRELTNA